MQKIIIKTKETKEIVDLTDKINSLIKNNVSKSGFCHLFLTHTTAALTTAYLNPDTELSIIDALQVPVQVPIPEGHKEFNIHEHTHLPVRLPDDIVASYIGTSLSIPFEKGKLLLGKIQRIVLVELNGPRKREILIEC
ncbi:YjbQ family protein [Candidatus Microgenomates bacterium]|nr:MAG: YjbQ family protein [Candidatus Microgenomates bacterium]